MTRILVLDDEIEIADLVTLYLINENYEIDTFYDSREAIASIDHKEYDLAILDLMIPHINGIQVCQHIRKSHAYPIIMLTAKGEDMDKINGLTMGADDYITKPFNPLEVCARVKAQLRRYQTYNRKGKDDKDVLHIKDLVIDKNRHLVTLNDEELNLTPTEFKILLVLSEHIGNVISSEELFERVWKEKYFDGNNTIMVHIRRLREKMKEPSRNPIYIKTVWGIGYRIDEN